MMAERSKWPPTTRGSLRVWMNVADEGAGPRKPAGITARSARRLRRAAFQERERFDIGLALAASRVTPESNGRSQGVNTQGQAIPLRCI